VRSIRRRVRSIPEEFRTTQPNSKTAIEIPFRPSRCLYSRRPLVGSEDAQERLDIEAISHDNQPRHRPLEFENVEQTGSTQNHQTRPLCDSRSRYLLPFPGIDSAARLASFVECCRSKDSSTRADESLVGNGNVVFKRASGKVRATRKTVRNRIDCGVDAPVIEP
jgi:hypothetical protein